MPGKNIIYKPGETVPRSGQYGTLGPRGGKTGIEITAVKGKVFPPTNKGGGFVLVDPTKHRH